MKPIPFPCPYGGKKHNAYAYSRTFVACPMHGALLYTDIPPETTYILKRKLRGWKTLADVARDVLRKILSLARL